MGVAAVGVDPVGRPGVPVPDLALVALVAQPAQDAAAVAHPGQRVARVAGAGKRSSAALAQAASLPISSESTGRSRSQRIDLSEDQRA